VKLQRIRDEGGMTLIELMIAISVLGVILVPVTTSFLLGILESTSAKERTADSSSAQLISSYLLADIQSSQSVATSGSGCGGGAGTVKLQIAWTDPDPAGDHDVVVAYVDQPAAAAGQRELHRYICTTTGGSTASDSSILALNLDTSTFAVTCKDAAGATVACASARNVAVHVEADSFVPDVKSSYEPFVIDFEATRRVSS
jgi:prepilin-type N-terminal cleavage/methylation domain-containing protein